jgi:low affinity Fe/Cu permease
MLLDGDGRGDHRKADEILPPVRGTWITRMVSRATTAAGSFLAILVAAALILAWLVGGLFVPGGYGDNAYQLPVSTVSSIVTFVMVFVIQSSQNRDNLALQTKVDAMADVLTGIAKRQGVNDSELLIRLAGLEEATEREIDLERNRVHQHVEITARSASQETTSAPYPRSMTYIGAERMANHWWNGTKDQHGRQDVYVWTDGHRWWAVEAWSGGQDGRSRRQMAVRNEQEALTVAERWRHLTGDDWQDVF